MKMSENPTSTLINGVDEVPVIKTEPVDPLLDEQVIPKEYITSTTNGLHDESDCEDISFFTQVEVDNTRKCLENMRLIIKDFETQLDWHLQQYMTLRNIFNPKRNLGKNQNRDDASKRQDLLSISQLSAIIANHPEGNKKFIKRKVPISNGAGGRKRRKHKDSESEDESEFSDGEDEYDEEDFDENDSEIDDPGTGKAKQKKKPKGKRGRNSDDRLAVLKDEIEEEIHELVVPKEEKQSEDEMYEEMPTPNVAKSPAKRGRKGKTADPDETKVKKASPKGKRGQKGMETIDLTSLKTCKVVLNRLDEDSIEVKAEQLDREDLTNMLVPKMIESLEDLFVDPEKPIFILKQDNYAQFDFDECKTSNVIVTYEDKEVLPEFIFMKKIANSIVGGLIKLVQFNVFDQYLNESKN